MQDRHAEMKVGLVVLGASFALLALLYFATGGALLRSHRTVHMRIEPGPLAPKEGDRITMRGIDVGTARSVGLWWETAAAPPGEAGTEGAPAGKRTLGVHVVAELVEGSLLPVGTTGTIKETITGSRVLDLVPGEDESRLLSDADTEASPILVRQVADLMSVAGKLEDVAADAQTLLRTATTTFEHATAAVDEVKGTVAALRGRVEGGDIDRSLENVAAATGSLRNAAAAVEQRIGPIADDLGAAVADFKRLAASGADLVEGLKPAVQGVLTDLRGVVARVDGVVEAAGPRVDRTLESLEGVGANLLGLAQDLRAEGPRVDRILRGLDRDLAGTLELLQDAGQNLVDATETIRASPWLLLNKPSTEVVAQADARNTMQNYVRAMTRLDRSARTVKDLLASGIDDDETRDLLARALTGFEASLERYRFFEERLMELLGAGRGPASAPAPAPAPRAAAPSAPPSAAPPLVSPQGR